MTYTNDDFFKKRPSDLLLEEAMNSVRDINPDLVKEFDDIVDEWKQES